MPEICIFCIKKQKKQNSSKQKLVLVETGDFEEKIKKYETTLGNQALLWKLGSVDFVPKKLRYHVICRKKYQKAAEQVSKTSQNREVAKCSTNLWHSGKDVHSEALISICLLVEDQVIYRWRCVGFKGRIQQLRFDPWRLGCWKSGCILHCTEAGGKTEVTFEKTYNYSQRKVQKRRLSHLPQQHHLRRSFEACWSSQIKTALFWINSRAINLLLVQFIGIMNLQAK